MCKCKKCNGIMSTTETNESQGFWYPTGFCEECFTHHYPNSVFSIFFWNNYKIE